MTVQNKIKRKKRIAIGLVLTVLQTMIYFIALNVGWRVGPLLHEPRTMTISDAVSFGVVMKLASTVFALMAFVVNLVDAIVDKQKWTQIVIILTSLSYIAYFSRDFSYIPFKTMLLLGAAIIGIVSRFPLKRMFDNSFNTRSSY